MVHNKIYETYTDFRTNVYYCLMGPKGQHKASKTPLAHESVSLLPSPLRLFSSQGFTHTWKQDTDPIQVHYDYKSKHLLGQCTINCTFLNKHYIYIYRVYYTSYMALWKHLIGQCLQRRAAALFLLWSISTVWANQLPYSRTCFH